MLEVKKTTFEVEGTTQECFIVTDGFSKVRICKCYHLYSHNTIFVTEWIEGDFNSEDEWDYDFDMLDEEDAVEIAKKYSIYLED